MNREIKRKNSLVVNFFYWYISGMKPFEFRKELGVSQEEMAKKIGCSKAMICMIESGKRVPSLAILKKYESLSGGKVSLRDF